MRRLVPVALAVCRRCFEKASSCSAVCRCFEKASSCSAVCRICVEKLVPVALCAGDVLRRLVPVAVYVGDVLSRLVPVALCRCFEKASSCSASCV